MRKPNLLNPKEHVMKRSKTIWYFLYLFFLISCQEEQNNSDKIKGTLSISIGLFISVNEVENNLKSTVDAEDFKVSIFNQGGTEVLTYENASEIPAEIELEQGQYYITAHSENDLPAAFDNPYYYGKSEVFSITPGGQQTIGVNCELANTMLTIQYSDNIKNNYSEYSTIVSSTAGSLAFVKDEVRAGYFQPLPLNISVTLTLQNGDGSFESKTLTGSIPQPQPKRHYEIHVDASPVGGSAILRINLDETTEPVEIVQINDGTTAPGVFKKGDLLITEIMYDPSSLSDTEGEWFEIYNNTSLPVDLHQVVIRNETNQHVIKSEVILEANHYMVLSRTSTATAEDKYVYGSLISLTNGDEASLSLYNYGTDGTNGSLICAVSFGGQGFPDGSGESICLSPLFLNAADAILGSSWCISTTAYSTGDLGTPGTINDTCP